MLFLKLHRYLFNALLALYTCFSYCQKLQPVYSSRYFIFDTILHQIKFSSDSLYNYQIFDQNGYVYKKGASNSGINLSLAKRGDYYLLLKKSPAYSQIDLRTPPDDIFLIRITGTPSFALLPDRVDSIDNFFNHNSFRAETDFYKYDSSTNILIFKLKKPQNYWLYNEKGELIKKGSSNSLFIKPGKFIVFLKDPRQILPDGIFHKKTTQWQQTFMIERGQ